MKKVVFVLSILIFNSCTKIEDDTDDVCNLNCTVLQGKSITLDNVGVSGLKISLNYIVPSEFYTRKIVETVTDENGNYHEEFFIRDEELNHMSEGFFEISYDDSNLDNNTFLVSGKSVSQSINPISTRDTIIENTYYSPKKTNIKVNLNNFLPIQDDDYFEVRALYPLGPNLKGYNDFLDSEYATGSSECKKLVASALNTKFTVFVAENEHNIIRILRRTNGVNTYEDIPVFVPVDNAIELTYDY